MSPSELWLRTLRRAFDLGFNVRMYYVSGGKHHYILSKEGSTPVCAEGCDEDDTSAKISSWLDGYALGKQEMEDR